MDIGGQHMSGVSEWRGYLLRAIDIEENFPAEYIEAGSWKMSRAIEDIKAYRDDNTRDLTRVVAKGHKASFSFNTIDGLGLSETDEIISFFNRAEAQVSGGADEQKIHLQFWDSKARTYKTGYFYRPATEFPINRYDQRDIKHGKLNLEFVEY